MAFENQDLSTAVVRCPVSLDSAISSGTPMSLESVSNGSNTLLPTRLRMTVDALESIPMTRKFFIASKGLTGR